MLPVKKRVRILDTERLNVELGLPSSDFERITQPPREQRDGETERTGMNMLSEMAILFALNIAIAVSALTLAMLLRDT